MLQYLIILLDDTSVSFCHYRNTNSNRRLIALDGLKAGILFAMKHNLMVQFVYPDYELPESYATVIESIDHHKIKPFSLKEDASVVVYDYREAVSDQTLNRNEKTTLVLRITKDELFSGYEEVIHFLKRSNRLSLVITDTDTFRKEDFDTYKKVLSHLESAIPEALKENDDMPQLNILSDRIQLEKMNNCNAGVENITLAPNGKFYVCPAFYIEDENDSAGNPAEGITISNRQLYTLAYAPVCRKCDAYHCKRCIWLNKKTTLEVNTPSHEQCVTAHLERNASRNLLNELHAKGFFPNKEIREITCLDPFEWKE
ncbi:MAG: CXXX repeat peptide maturase [Tannerellaceae bacterium]|jgi:CXXX repeat peptide maturase|nr:CXXX repeat peptide maturase [Tannerellaceae bacterium]